MSTTKEIKLKNLLEQWPPGLVATSSWMKSLSISDQLVQRYLKSGWVEALGRGAYKKSKDKVHWYGALASIQQQLSLNVHLGGPTALAVKGTSHYVRLGYENVYLFSQLDQKLPKWFMEHKWDNSIRFVKTSFLPNNLAIKEYEFNGIYLKTSVPERAILECLYLSPKRFDLLECYQLMEGMTALRPDILQELLEQCGSIHVKRLFLYIAKKAKLPIMEYLDLGRIALGTGDRSVVPKGVYNAEFKISIPKELADYV